MKLKAHITCWLKEWLNPTKVSYGFYGTRALTRKGMQEVFNKMVGKMTDTHDFQNENVLTCASETSEGTQELKPCAEKMPERIFAGFMGGGRFWGEATPSTHPDNTIYVREDVAASTTPPEVQALQETIESQKQTFDALNKKVQALADAVRQTLEDNMHLADGDNCTLYALREALAAFEKREERRINQKGICK